jgi:hypothetical protein
MKLKTTLAIATTAAVLAALGAAVCAQDKQDKYSLQTPSGIAFSDFKGYEDWVAVSSTHTPNDRLKVMVANPTMIKAYRAGIPGNGQPFPEGSKIVKLQWKIKKMAEAPFDANVPDTFAEVFLMQKDSKRFPDSGGWGYAVFNYDAVTDKYTPTADPANCGHVCHVAVKNKDHVFHAYQRR